MKRNTKSSGRLAAKTTKSASKQTYYTIRFLVDRERIPDAYRAYAYFRWVDDTLDEGGLSYSERIAFVKRQSQLMDQCYLGIWPDDATEEEDMLVHLVQNDQDRQSGLGSYINKMMAVMVFDTQRRGKLITQKELDEYTLDLSIAVTEALHYFIGNRCYSPNSEERYLSATAAHIVHMLRDTYDDHKVGYFNIPREYLEAHGLSPQDVDKAAYRVWIQRRISVARNFILAGKEHLSQVESFRCRIAGYAYIGRFEGVLDCIERENYTLRPCYPERKKPTNRMKLFVSTLWQAFTSRPDLEKPAAPARQMRSTIGE